MQLTAADEEFRAQVRDWLEVNVAGEFAGLPGLGGPGREHEHFEEPGVIGDRALGLPRQARG